MISDILATISCGATKGHIRSKIANGAKPIPLFTPFPELDDQTLCYHLIHHQKYKQWSLEDFLQAKAIDLNEIDSTGHRLMYFFIKKPSKEYVKTLLREGDTVSDEEYNLAKINLELRNLLHYRPGRDQPSIYEVVKKPCRNDQYFKKITPLLLDEAETTDSESSNTDDSQYDIPDVPHSKYDEVKAEAVVEKFNDVGKVDESLTLVEYRGFHYGKKFSHQDRQASKVGERHSQPTYSLAAIDPDFHFQDIDEEADDERDDEGGAEDKTQVKKDDGETDVTLCDRKAQLLKEKWQETKSAPDDSKKYKTSRTFDDLSFRLLQEYIMAFRRLVIDGEIQSQYGFQSAKNPFLSTTCNAGIAILYASGVRHFKITEMWRDPRYRRSTGKPKHPIIGYVDAYILDIDFARANTCCRDRLLAQEKISLNQMYRNHEGERIFIAEIPKNFHQYRFFVQFPDFSSDLTDTAAIRAWKSEHHIACHAKTIREIQDKLIEGDDRKTVPGKEQYLQGLSSTADNMNKYLGARIENWMRHTLFGVSKTIIVCDDKLDDNGKEQVCLKRKSCSTRR